MVKIKITGKPEVKYSPFAFNHNAFASLNMMENPTQEDVDQCEPFEGFMVFDYNNKGFEVISKTVEEDGNVIVELEEFVDDTPMV